jgi:hypothetical protein
MIKVVKAANTNLIVFGFTWHTWGIVPTIYSTWVTNTISYTVYNCPNTEKYRVNQIHIGRGSRVRYEFYWPDMFPYWDNCTLCNEFILILQPNLISNVFHIRTMNLSWFWIHTTMYLTYLLYLIFQFSMGYGICHGFVSIFHLWLHFFPY